MGDSRIRPVLAVLDRVEEERRGNHRRTDERLLLELERVQTPIDRRSVEAKLLYHHSVVLPRR